MNEWVIYTLHLDHYATGEGRLIQVLVTVAVSEAEARQRFWTTFWPGDKGAEDYFGPVLVLTRGLDRERLGHWLTGAFIDSLERTLPYNGVFTLSWQFNRS
ncbi:hypothetical protein [Deinococcus aestuarii]|uniref:hypothetical protein n=1 Tax=Deinococcus aestuarii TaxID=2774531 RepID=UPI001C0AA30F|nr:hypothetical protein [Deinococcus aestuarii]